MNVTKLLRHGIWLLGCGWLCCGCFTTPKATDLTPVGLSFPQGFDAPVEVELRGDAKVEKTVVIPQAEMALALREAVVTSGLFPSTGDDGGEGYQLLVVITGYDPPQAGFTITATLTSRWLLTREGGSEPLFQDFLKSTYTCGVGDAFVGMKRFRLANEGAVRAMIADGLEKISRVAQKGSEP